MKTPTRRAGRIRTPVAQLDLATVIKVSQAVSGEIVLEKLIDTFMRTAIEQAGAERGLLIVMGDGEPRLEAAATTVDGTVLVQLCDQPLATGVLPEAVLHHVLRTGESVILDDAVVEPPFSSDPYMRQREARSILCLPLLAQAKLIGVLYLENGPAPRVFAATRVAVLKLLASQAAIALENARLHRDLAEREAKIRHLVDANIVGISIYDLEGRIHEANDAFLRIVGYDRDDLKSGRVRWSDITPPEWLERERHEWVPQLLAKGALQPNGLGRLPYEKEYFRKDGSRVPVLIGAASFEEKQNQGVAFVLELSDRKQAEAEARESERRYREVQMELAHANRAATMGQLTASIAHEVKQPIAAAAANAAAALRWLDTRPPNVDETRQALARIVSETMRASDIICRIRNFIKKTPPRKDTLDINEVVREVIELTRGEAIKYGIAVQAVFGEGLPFIRGDRVQLQQVMLNLIVNAIEAMSATAGGPRALRISTAADSSTGVSFAVSDSGPGLPADGIERLFDPFYTTKPSGLGMGLSICRKIVDAYGGRLSATPNVPRGAVFQLTVPAHPDSPIQSSAN